MLVSPVHEDVADTSREVDEDLVGHSSQEGAPLQGRHTALPAVQLDALLQFLHHIVHVQTRPEGRTISRHTSLKSARWFFTTRFVLSSASC